MDYEHLENIVSFRLFYKKNISNINNLKNIFTGEGQHEEIKVEIDKKNKKKPFLGGFKHKVTGVQYHNASAQTNPKPLRWPKTTLFDRDAQVFCGFYVHEKTHSPIRSFYLFITFVYIYTFN